MGPTFEERPENFLYIGSKITRTDIHGRAPNVIFALLVNGSLDIYGPKEELEFAKKFRRIRKNYGSV